MNISRFLLAFFLGFLLTTTSCTAHKITKDNKITMTEAKRLASNAREDTDFPIVVNDQVLKQLNRLLGKPSGRKHMQVCFKRMKAYKPMIAKRIDKYDLPEELLAVPLVESSYQNIHSPQGWGSGLWMFVKPTARSYGLKVNKKVDQRLNVRLSTDAALKYLKANYKRFENWELALLAYNMGENKVYKGIKKTGSRDAWKLIRKGYHGDKEYLAKIMAVVIIMKNQQVLR